MRGDKWNNGYIVFPGLPTLYLYMYYALCHISAAAAALMRSRCDMCVCKYIYTLLFLIYLLTYVFHVLLMHELLEKLHVCSRALESWGCIFTVYLHAHIVVCVVCMCR
jgi:hypothetical protein